MFRIGDEPIPRYRLQAPLGAGQFGAVWKARAPGGAPVALKFIELKGSSGFKEYRGIQRVLPLRHSHLVPMTAIFLLDADGNVLDDAALQRLEADAQTSGQPDPRESESDFGATLQVETPPAVMLVVAMALGDKTLTDRLEECQQQLVADVPENQREGRLRKLIEAGRAGIPVQELLTYMDEAAKGIDFLNTKEHELGDGTTGTIQHCDIKPANIMLVGGSAQVCDFGLARELASGDNDIRRTQSGIAGSPLYMAPECIAGPEPSRATDQYSLAISYFELRTGDIPFGLSTKRSKGAILVAHAQGKLDLVKLPAAERRVIAKAASMDPGERYDTCRKFVRTLRKAVKESTGFDEDDSARCEPGSSPPLPEPSLMETLASNGAALETEPALETILPASTESAAKDTDALLADVPYPIPTIDGSSFSTTAANSETKPPEPQRARPSSRVWLIGLLLALAATVLVFALWPRTTDEAVCQMINEDLEDRQFSKAFELLPRIKDPETRLEQSRRITKTWRDDANQQADAAAALEMFQQILEVLPGDLDTLDFRAEKLESLINESEQSIDQGQLETARPLLDIVFQHLPKAEDTRDAELEQRARFAEVDYRARTEPADWGQVVNQLEPLQSDRDHFSPSQAARFQVLSVLAEAGLNGEETLTSDEFLERLVALRDLEPELRAWEQQQLTALESRVLDQLVRLPSRSERQRQVMQALGTDAQIAALLEDADALRREGKFAEARDQLTTARLLADSQAAKGRIDRLQTLVELEDPDTKADVALKSLARSIANATAADTAWLLEACGDLPAVVDREPQRLDRVIEQVVAARERFSNVPGVVEQLDSFYVPLLRTRILLGLKSNADTDYPVLLADCDYLRTAGQSDPLVDACYAECLIETAGGQGWNDANDAAQAALARVSELPDPSFASFVHYVTALVAYRDPIGAGLPSAVAQLQQALDPAASSSWAVESPQRRRIAASILIERAKELRTRKSVPEPAFEADDALAATKLLDQVPTLFQDEPQQRSVLGNGLQADWLLNHALAQGDLEGFDTDEAAARNVRVAVGALTNIEHTFTADDDIHLTLASARAFRLDHTASGYVRAVSDLAEVLSAMPRRIRRAGLGLAWNQRVVLPAWELAEKSTEPQYADGLDDALKARLAAIYAAKGRLIQRDFEVRESSERGYDDAYQAFSQAAKLAPKAEYFVDLGETLIRRDTARPANSIGPLRSLTDQALAVDPTFGRAFGLRGYARVLEARSKADPDEKRRLLGEAMAAYNEAIDRSSVNSEDRYGHLIGRSTAYVESVFLSGDDETKLGQLTKAAEDAEAATRIESAAEPEYAWIAWGNATEDMAYYLKKTEYYTVAIEKFRRAVRAAFEAGRSRSASYMNQGRCRFRHAVFGGLQDAARARELDDSIGALQQAVAESQLRHDTFGEPRDGAIEAEAHFWISRVHQERGEFQSGYNAAIEAAELAKQFDPINVPKYQTEAAELAFRANHSDKAQQLAKQVLQSDLGLNPDRGLLRRAMVVVASSTSTLAEQIKLSNEYLQRLAGDGASNVAQRMELRLWRSETIADSMDSEAAKSYGLAEQDANDILKQVDALDEDVFDRSTLNALRARSWLVLGTLNAIRYHQPRSADTAQQTQEIGLRVCEQLKKAIPLLADGSKADTDARIVVARTTLYLLSTDPKPAVNLQRRLKVEAEAVIKPVVNSKIIDTNSPDYRVAKKHADALRDYSIGVAP